MKVLPFPYCYSKLAKRIITQQDKFKMSKLKKEPSVEEYLALVEKEELTSDDLLLINKGFHATLHALDNMNNDDFIESVIQNIDNNNKGRNDITDIRTALDNIAQLLKEQENSKNELLSIISSSDELSEEIKAGLKQGIDALLTPFSPGFNLLLTRINIHATSIYKQLELSQIINGKLNIRLKNTTRDYVARVKEVAEEEWEKRLETTYDEMIALIRKKYTITEKDGAIKKVLNQIDPLPADKCRRNGKIVDKKTHKA